MAKQCNFQILGGEATGTYRFKKGFYGLTTIANEFQRNMEETLRGEQNATTILGEILVYSNGTKEEHMKTVIRVCKRLNDAGVRLDGGNSVFAATRVEWAGYELEQHGSWPINSAAQGISGNLRPKSVKQLKTF